MAHSNAGLSERLKRKAQERGEARKRESTALLGEAVEVRSIMVSEKHRLIDEAFVRKGKNMEPILAKLVPALLQKTLYDPATGQPVFATVADVNLFLDSIPDGGEEAEEVQAVTDLAMTVSGLNKAAEREAAKNSEASEG